MPDSVVNPSMKTKIMEIDAHSSLDLKALTDVDIGIDHLDMK